MTPSLAAADRVAADLDATGWSVQPGFLDAALVASLRNESAARRAEFHRAGTGRGQGHRSRESARGDDVLWLDGDRDAPGERGTLGALEALRVHLNRTLFLGLDRLEAHVAVYPVGAVYARHLDAFHGPGPARVVSTVLYLNDDWAEADGGHLRLFLDGAQPEPFHDVTPTGGTLVAFLSGQVEHEVRPARRERMSVAGWFSARP